MTDAAIAVDTASVAMRPARRVREEQRARTNTRRVKRLRVLMPAMGVLIAAVLTVGAVLPKIFPIGAIAGLSLTAEGLVMKDPHLAGHLGGGRRYEVGAQRAIQSLLTPSRLSLEGLKADLDMGQDQVTLRSTAATFDTSTEILNLQSGIRIASTDGSNAHLDEATVFFQDGRMESKAGITIDTVRGEIRAGRIDVLDGGDLIRFSEGVAITIHPAT